MLLQLVSRVSQYQKQLCEPPYYKEVKPDIFATAPSTVQPLQLNGTWWKSILFSAHVAIAAVGAADVILTRFEVTVLHTTTITGHHFRSGTKIWRDRYFFQIFNSKRLDFRLHYVIVHHFLLREAASQMNGTAVCHPSTLKDNRSEQKINNSNG
ncbi:MAG TPA: hypothetical protein VGR84_04420 [Candidatus Acidoferrales bacterium]|nr:hypothetical protein [Candidatus Acidoferrales bacterium]